MSDSGFLLALALLSFMFGIDITQYLIRKKIGIETGTSLFYAVVEGIGVTCALLWWHFVR